MKSKTYTDILKTTLAGALALSFGIASPASAATLAYQGPAIAWPEIKAASAIVYDPVSNVVLYEKDADSVRSLASLSKLMTAAIVDDLLYSNSALEKQFIVIKNSINENEADRKLVTGSRWLPDDLVKYMLIGSSNKAAQNLASQLIPESSFVSLMNFKAKEWGLKDTVFYNPSGLPVTHKSVVGGKIVTTETAGSASTARQASALLWDILQTHIALLDITHEQIGIFQSPKDIITLTNTDTLTASSGLPIIAGKTGFTDIAGGNLAVVLQPTPQTHPHVIVVLGSTVADRFTDVVALASSSPYIVTSN